VQRLMFCVPFLVQMSVSVAAVSSWRLSHTLLNLSCPALQPHSLADKRCKNFGTCSSSTGSAVNAKLLGYFTAGQRLLAAGSCDQASQQKSVIISQMTVPLVQGLLRYLYKADPAGEAGGPKEIAEGWAFAAAVLPQLHKCDPQVAALVRANTEIGAAQPVSSGFKAVVTALQSTYSCMGFTCADVGGLLEDDAVAGKYIAGLEPCNDAAEAFASIAHYQPLRYMYSLQQPCLPCATSTNAISLCF
jgi:hypothetical protein